MSTDTQADAGPRHSSRASLFRYAVVDLASAPDLRPILLGRQRIEAEPLLARKFPARLLQVGPWLADLALVPGLRAKLDHIGSNKAWGYFVDGSVDIISMRHTLRRFNMIEIPNPTRIVLFRYWDPRVMNTFLGAATRTQRARLFEFIDRIEGPGGSFQADSNGEQTLTRERPF